MSTITDGGHSKLSTNGGQRSGNIAFRTGNSDYFSGGAQVTTSGAKLRSGYINIKSGRGIGREDNEIRVESPSGHIIVNSGASSRSKSGSISVRSNVGSSTGDILLKTTDASLSKSATISIISGDSKHDSGSLWLVEKKGGASEGVHINSGATDTSGAGAISIKAGSGEKFSGGITMRTNSAAKSGNIALQTFSGALTGGIKMKTGKSVDTNGAHVILHVGDANSNFGGTLNIFAGDSSGRHGGNIIAVSGKGQSSGMLSFNTNYGIVKSGLGLENSGDVRLISSTSIKQGGEMVLQASGTGAGLQISSKSKVSISASSEGVELLSSNVHASKNILLETSSSRLNSGRILLAQSSGASASEVNVRSQYSVSLGTEIRLLSGTSSVSTGGSISFSSGEGRKSGTVKLLSGAGSASAGTIGLQTGNGRNSGSVTFSSGEIFSGENSLRFTVGKVFSTESGSFSIQASDSHLGRAGGIYFNSGAARQSSGGSIILAGASAPRTGGNVLLRSGNGKYSRFGGDIKMIGSGNVGFRGRSSDKVLIQTATSLMKAGNMHVSGGIALAYGAPLLISAMGNVTMSSNEYIEIKSGTAQKNTGDIALETGKGNSGSSGSIVFLSDSNIDFIAGASSLKGGSLALVGGGGSHTGGGVRLKSGASEKSAYSGSLSVFTRSGSSTGNMHMQTGHSFESSAGKLVYHTEQSYNSGNIIVSNAASMAGGNVYIISGGSSSETGGFMVLNSGKSKFLQSGGVSINSKKGSNSMIIIKSGYGFRSGGFAMSVGISQQRASDINLMAGRGGGNLTFKTGDSNYFGGNFIVASGKSNSLLSGNVDLNTNGGKILLSGGFALQDAGNIEVRNGWSGSSSNHLMLLANPSILEPGHISVIAGGSMLSTGGEIEIMSGGGIRSGQLHIVSEKGSSGGNIKISTRESEHSGIITVTSGDSRISSSIVQVGGESLSVGSHVNVRSGSSSVEQHSGSINVISGNSDSQDGGHMVFQTAPGKLHSGRFGIFVGSSQRQSGTILMSTSSSQEAGSLQIGIQKSFQGGNIYFSSGSSILNSRGTADMLVLAGSGKSIGGEVVIKATPSVNAGTVHLKSGGSDFQSGHINIQTSRSTASGSLTLKIKEGRSGGELGLNSGIGKISGDINFFSGQSQTSSGPIVLESSYTKVYTGQSSTNEGGNIGFWSGNGEKTSGNITIISSGLLVETGKSDGSTGNLNIENRPSQYVGGKIRLRSGLSTKSTGGITSFKTGKSLGYISGRLSIQSPSSKNGEASILFHTGNSKALVGRILLQTGGAKRMSRGINIKAGDGLKHGGNIVSKAGGNLKLHGGRGMQSGSLTIQSGITGHKNSGLVNVETGPAVDVSGEISITANKLLGRYGLDFRIEVGESSAAASGITLRAGDASLATGGNLRIFSKTSTKAYSGHLSIFSEVGLASGNMLVSSGKSGLYSGEIQVLARAGESGGDIFFGTGKSFGMTNPLLLKAGNSGSYSGSVILEAGMSQKGTSGNININTANSKGATLTVVTGKSTKRSGRIQNKAAAQVTVSTGTSSKASKIIFSSGQSLSANGGDLNFISHGSIIQKSGIGYGVTETEAAIVEAGDSLRGDGGNVTLSSSGSIMFSTRGSKYGAGRISLIGGTISDSSGSLVSVHVAPQTYGAGEILLRASHAEKWTGGNLVLFGGKSEFAAGGVRIYSRGQKKSGGVSIETPRSNLNSEINMKTGVSEEESGGISVVSGMSYFTSRGIHFRGGRSLYGHGGDLVGYSGIGYLKSGLVDLKTKTENGHILMKNMYSYSLRVGGGVQSGNIVMNVGLGQFSAGASYVNAGDSLEHPGGQSLFSVRKRTTVWCTFNSKQQCW